MQIQPLYNNIYMQPFPSYNPLQMPAGQRNYIIADKNKVDSFVKQKENALPAISNILAHSNN